MVNNTNFSARFAISDDKTPLFVFLVRFLQGLNEALGFSITFFSTFYLFFPSLTSFNHSCSPLILKEIKPLTHLFDCR